MVAAATLRRAGAQSLNSVVLERETEPSSSVALWIFIRAVIRYVLVMKRCMP